MHWHTFIADAGLLGLGLRVVVLRYVGPTSQQMGAPSPAGAAVLRDADLLMVLDPDEQRAQQLLQKWH